MSHTPGPWNVKAGRVVSGAVTICDVSIAYKSSESMEDNARLIAAAPDLLAACKMASDLSQHADGCKWFDIPAKELSGSTESMARQAAACDCHLKACRAAIAKAEGRQ